MNRLTHRTSAAASTLLLLSVAACAGGGDRDDSAQPAGDSQSESPTSTATGESADSDDAGRDGSGRDDSGGDDSGRDDSGRDDSGRDDSGRDDSGRDDSGGDDPKVRAATTVETSRSRFGPILVDAKGRTLYMFDPDGQGRSVCDADCLQSWPVAKAPGATAKGADDSLLGITRSTDGTRMVTYNDWPLYYFAQDGRPGDVNGQGVNGVWWVMSPQGRPIRQM